MLRILAILVVGAYLILWASGNDVQSVKQSLVHWADGNAQDVSGAGRYADDWGH